MSLNVPNLDRLISHMEGLRPEQFNMRHLFSSPAGEDAWNGRVPELNVCGTAACIAGECAIVAGKKEGDFWDAADATYWLGVPQDAAQDMFMPDGYYHTGDYPLSRALRMLRHLRAEFLRTGTVVVDWDAPEAVEAPRKPWAPPVVIGADKPLPAELTRLVREPATLSLATKDA